MPDVQAYILMYLFKSSPLYTLSRILRYQLRHSCSAGLMELRASNFVIHHQSHRPLQSHTGYRLYWMPPLVWSFVSAKYEHITAVLCDTLHWRCQSLRGYSLRLMLWPSTVSEVLVLFTSNKSSAQSRICHVGHSVRLAAATCSFRGQTRPSASEVSPLRLLSSGTHSHLTSAHCTTVASSSDRSWKPTFPISL